MRLFANIIKSGFYLFPGFLLYNAKSSFCTYLFIQIYTTDACRFKNRKRYMPVDLRLLYRCYNFVGCFIKIGICGHSFYRIIKYRTYIVFAKTFNRCQTFVNIFSPAKLFKNGRFYKRFNRQMRTDGKGGERPAETYQIVAAHQLKKPVRTAQIGGRFT